MSADNLLALLARLTQATVRPRRTWRARVPGAVRTRQASPLEHSSRAAAFEGSFVELAGSTNATLTYADLAGADLSNANLPCTNLFSADLTLADLTRAKLKGANLADADLT